jgi:hypothetical protein
MIKEFEAADVLQIKINYCQKASPVSSPKALVFQCYLPPCSIPMNVIKYHTPKYNTVY